MRGQRGFTLLELTLVVIVVAILATVGIQILGGGFNAYRATRAALTTAEKLNYALERMAREIRETRYNGGAYSMSAMTANRLVFTKNDTASTIVTLDATTLPFLTLSYSLPAVSATLTDQVASHTFSYLQADGLTPASGAADVVFIDVTTNLADDGATYSARRRIALRDLQ